jgi:hypothetical protein
MIHSYVFALPEPKTNHKFSAEDLGKEKKKKKKEYLSLN